MTPDIGLIGIWTSAFEAQPSAAARDAAAELDDLGYGALWINEATGRDPFVLATMLLSATSAMTVATGIANVYARDAMTMAACQRTLSEAFPGRFLLGLGVSSPVLVEKVRRHSYDRPYSYMASYLTAMDESRFDAVGPTHQPPRVLAALGPKMLKLSATRADGAHPYLTTPDHTRLAREAMGPGTLLAPEQMVVLENDIDRARAIGRSALSFYLRAPGYLATLRRLGFDDDDWSNPKAASDRLVDAIVAWGDIDAVVTRVAEHRAAGADHVCLQVLRGEPGLPLLEWRELAAALL